MSELLQFNWRSFDLSSGVKVGTGLLVMLLLTQLTGQSWLATALVAMFAWMANGSGELKERIINNVMFAAGAILITLVHGLIQTSLWPNVITVMVFGFLGTAALIRGVRPFMLGFCLICWAIYGPLMVASTDMLNCLLAVIAGSGAVMMLNAIGEVGAKKNQVESVNSTTEVSESQESLPDLPYIIGYAFAVSVVLGLTTYYGWVELKTDPSLMAGGAFFVIGFDWKKTWIAGLGRVLGLVAGSLVGLVLAQLLGPGIILNLLMVIACGLSFAAAGVHPGAWMFFFMVFVAIGWQGLDQETFNLTVTERFYGELLGIAAAMIVIIVLQRWQDGRKQAEN